MSENTSRSAIVEMLIKKPITEVFDAFVDPEIITKFWFTKSTGKLEEGAKVDWIWEQYNLTVPVTVKLLEHNKKIIIEWGTGENLSKVEWTFTAVEESQTKVHVVSFNFLGTEAEVINKVIDSKGGFTLVLAGLKAWLEHGIQLDLI